MIIGLFVSGAHAAPTYYTQTGALPGALPTLTAKRNTFRTDASSAAVPLTLEGFESSVSGNPLDYGPFTMTLINGGSGFVSQFGNNLTTTQGTGVVDFNITGATSVLFNFDSDINAFGIDITSIDFNTTVSFLDSRGNTLSNFGVPNTFAGATFFGILNSQPFNMVRFNFSGFEVIAFDQLEFGPLVPEPPIMVSLLITAGIHACLARRRLPRRHQCYS